MRTILLYLLAMVLISCGGSKGAIHNFDEITSNHQRIAIIPIETTIKLSKKDLETTPSETLEKVELDQSIEVQDAIESFLVGRKLRVRVQSQSVTNSKLKAAGIDLNNINNIDVTRLCQILQVDAVISGEMETTKPMSDELARGLNVAKGLALQTGNSLLRTVSGNIKTDTNEGWCSLSLFEAKYGDRLWTYREDLALGAGSNTKDIIHKLMKKGVNDFPYRQ